MSVASHREVVLVHSSDLHLSADPIFGSSCSSNELSVLQEVLAAATAARTDLLILAGDPFDLNRQPSQLLDRAARTMGEFGAPIVILPGNHDPLTPDSVYRRAELAAASNVCVLGLSVDEPDKPDRLLGSWLIRREELSATGADYIALGHWNRAARVGDQRINAYYSGCPDYAGTVNVVRLRQDGAVEVTQAPLRLPVARAGMEAEET